MDPNETNDDDFDSAFEEATSDAPVEPTDVEDEADGAVAEESGSESDAADEKTGEAESDEDVTGEDKKDAGYDGEQEGDGEDAAAELEDGGDPEKADAKATPAKGEEGKPAYDEATLKRAMDLLNEENKGKAEEPAAAQEDEPADPEPQRTWKDYVPEDKREVIETYEREWAEVSEAESIKRTAELQLLQDTLYSDLRSALAPVFETTQTLKVNAHLDAVRQQHSDLDEVRQPLQEWIETQPEFVRPAYLEVAQKGSAKQVIELINQFKQSTGRTGAAPEVPAPSARQPQQRPAKPQPSAAAKRALAAAPSPNKAEVPGSANPDDFDAAFDEAAGIG